MVANAGISAALERRGPEWASIALEFVVLAVVNTVLLLTYAALVSDDGINRALSLFFGFLLTMIIVLFDRFRAERISKLAALGPIPAPRLPLHSARNERSAHPGG